MIFSLDVRRARKGDCFLLHYGTKTKPRVAVIDGGPSKVYKPFLRPRLEAVKKARGLSAVEPLAVDLVMVSHVDDDHVNGLLEFTKELRTPGGAPVARVRRLWHNSFDEVVGQNPKELTAGLLASIAQGHQLRQDAKALGVELNPEFGGKLILAGKKSVSLGDGLSFVVAGPMKAEALELQKAHDKWLEARAKKDKPAEAALAAYLDESVANLSSLVVLAKAGGKTMLLTGDARGDKVLEGLELAGLLAKGGQMRVDLLKVPHHGSARNLDRDFFERIRADHYVISGDGEHGNPERESLEMLFGARGKEPFTLHLTYPVKEMDVERKADWEKKAGNVWDAAAQGLEAYFAKRPPAAGQVVRVSDGVGPHVIDLLDPLGY